ncbi:MAG: hypothetical protein Q8K40_05940 [Ignavibacteria bacterium]|nr:hypothetical protein [Ignavibacteria bacterium]
MTTITIPKKLTKGGDLMVVEKENFEKLVKENAELKLAMRAILEGELALRQGKTRSFGDFLKSKFPRYAKNY